MIGFNDVEFPALPDTARVKDGYAWNVISELTKKYPNENFNSLGPLTNVALAMKQIRVYQPDSSKYLS